MLDAGQGPVVEEADGLLQLLQLLLHPSGLCLRLLGLELSGGLSRHCGGRLASRLLRDRLGLAQPGRGQGRGGGGSHSQV